MLIIRAATFSGKSGNLDNSCNSKMVGETKCRNYFKPNIQNSVRVHLLFCRVVSDLLRTSGVCHVLCSGGQKGWHVFYHFVGAVPGSTELLGLLCRLLYEMKAVKVCVDNK